MSCECPQQLLTLAARENIHVKIVDVEPDEMAVYWFIAYSVLRSPPHPNISVFESQIGEFSQPKAGKKELMKKLPDAILAKQPQSVVDFSK